MEKLKVFINGEFVESKTDVWYDLHNPSTGEITGQAPCCTTEEVEAAVQAAKAAFPGWSGTPAIKRAQIMYKIRELIIRDYEELTYTVAEENGKTWGEADGDVAKAKEGTELATQVTSLMMGESMMDASRGYDTVKYREPLGVFAGIAPVNFPAMIPFGWMAPTCIATGNTMVLKAALAAFCAFWVSVSSTAARSKSSPNLRAVMGFVLSGVRYDNLPRLSLTVTPCCSSFPEKSSKETAEDRAARIVRRSFSLSVSNFVTLGGSPAAAWEAFSLSSAACPFRFAQYSRSVTRFLLPFSKSI